MWWNFLGPISSGHPVAGFGNISWGYVCQIQKLFKEGFRKHNRLEALRSLREPHDPHIVAYEPILRILWEDYQDLYHALEFNQRVGGGGGGSFVFYI